MCRGPNYVNGGFGERHKFYGFGIESQLSSNDARYVENVLDKACLDLCIALDDFQRVKAGDLLIEIDDFDYRAKVAQAEGLEALPGRRVPGTLSATNLAVDGEELRVGVLVKS